VSEADRRRRIGINVLAAAMAAVLVCGVAVTFITDTFGVIVVGAFALFVAGFLASLLWAIVRGAAELIVEKFFDRKE